MFLSNMVLIPTEIENGYEWQERMKSTDIFHFIDDVHEIWKKSGAFLFINYNLKKVEAPG